MFTRRQLLKAGLAGTGYVLLPRGRVYGDVPSTFWDNPQSPPTTPFVAPLQIPPPPTRSMTAFAPTSPDWTGFVNPDAKQTAYYRIVAEERMVKMHRDLPETAIWGYRDGHPDAPPWKDGMGRPIVLGP